MFKASLLPAMALALLASCAGAPQEQSLVIKTDVPERPAGQ